MKNVLSMWNYERDINRQLAIETEWSVIFDHRVVAPDATFHASPFFDLFGAAYVPPLAGYQPARSPGPEGTGAMGPVP